MEKETSLKEANSTKILLPKVDIVFKLLFGDARNSEILASFLKAILDLSDDEYDNITIVDPQLKRETENDKLGIVDVRLNTKSGKIIHIEIQIAPQNELPERITYYNSKMLVTQLKAGYDYSELQKVISIVITDFELIKKSPEYHHIFQMNDKKTGRRFTDLIEVHTLEMNKIPDTTDDTTKYDWIKFLKAEREEEIQMIAEKNPEVKKAYAELKVLSQDERNQLIYEAREKALRDERARLKTATQLGTEQGKMEVAEQMLNDNVDISLIMKYTGLSKEDILAINMPVQ